MLILPEEQLEELVEILRRFKAQTSQEAIYLEVEHDVALRLI